MNLMQPKEFDMDFPRGDTTPVSFEITDLNGEILDLTGAEIYFTFKLNKNVTQYIFQKRYTRDEITVEGKDGSLVLEHNDTAELPYGKYYYDISIKSGTYVKTLVRGWIELTDEATFKANE